MVLPDVLAGDRDWPHETRIIGAFPFVAALAGLGIGGVLDWLSPWRNLKLATGLVLAAAVGFTMQAQLAALGAEFEKIPEPDVDQMAKLTAEAAPDRLVADAGADAEPIPALEFHQTLGW